MTRCSKGSGSSSCALDAPALVVPLARLNAARPSRLPCLRRGGLPTRVSAGGQRVCWTARVHARPSTGCRRRRRAAAVARSRGPDASALARAGGGRVLCHVLLRLGDTVLSGTCGVRSRRSHTDSARAGVVFVLAPVGARAHPSELDRPGRWSRDSAPARDQPARGVRRAALRARRRNGRAAASSVGREWLAQSACKSRVDGARSTCDPRRAHASGERAPVARFQG